MGAKKFEFTATGISKLLTEILMEEESLPKRFKLSPGFLLMIDFLDSAKSAGCKCILRNHVNHACIGK